MTEDLLRTL